MNGMMTRCISLLCALLAALLLSPSSGAGARSPGSNCCDEVAWSPDGMRIAYVAGATLGIVAPSGGSRRIWRAIPPRSAAVEVTSPVWSPDATRIAFSELTHSTEPGDGYWETSRVLSVDRRARGLRVEHPTGRAPSWSADGRFLAVELALDGQWQPTGIAIVDRPAGTTSAFEHIFSFRPRWAPHGSALVVARGASSTYDLILMGVDGSERRLVRVNSAVGDPAFAWSPDGRRIAYVWDSVGTRLALLDVRSGRSKRLPAGRVVTAGGFSWSPDGRTIAIQAYAPTRADPADCLRLVDVATAAVRRIGCPRGLTMPEATPTWAPDGTRVALPARGGIVTFDVQRSRARLVPL